MPLPGVHVQEILPNIVLPGSCPQVNLCALQAPCFAMQNDSPAAA